MEHQFDRTRHTVILYEIQRVLYLGDWWPQIRFKIETCQELVGLLCLFYILLLGHNYIYCIYLLYQQCPDQVLSSILLNLTHKSC